MNTHAYIEDCKYSLYPTSYVAEDNLLGATKTMLYREQFGRRFIIYYIRTFKGIFKAADGECPEIFIFFHYKISDILTQIKSLEKVYERKDLYYALRNYPYISHIAIDIIGISSGGEDYEETKQYYQNFKLAHPEYFTEIKFADIIDGRFALKISYHGNCLSTINIRKDVQTLINYADHVALELKSFKIDLSNMKMKESYLAMKNSSISPGLQKAILVGGFFMVKFAAKGIARAVGSDYNIELPEIDIPDIDIDGIDINDLDIPDVGDVDLDTDNNYDFDTINSTNADSQILNTISFGHAPNDGTYTNSGKTVHIQVAGGNDKGSFDVYYHHGDKYIDFQDQWVKIQGKTRFHLNGNDYIIK